VPGPLRPGGRLVFMAESTLARMCLPEEGPATERLARDLFGLHQVVRRGSSGSTYQQFTLPHGERIRLLAGCGLVVEDLIEVQVPPGAANNLHHGFAQVATYEPASRFWPFQWIESGWLLALSLLLMTTAIWLVRRRAT